MNRKKCLLSLVMFFIASVAFAIPDVPTTPDHKAHWNGAGWTSFNGNPSEAAWGTVMGRQNVLVMNNNEDATRDKRVWIYMEKSGSLNVEISDSWACGSDNNYDNSYYTMTKEFVGDYDPLNHWAPIDNSLDWYLWYYVIDPQPYKEAFKFHIIDSYDPGFVPSGDLWIFTSCPGGPAPVPEPLSIILLVSTLFGLFLKKRS